MKLLDLISDFIYPPRCPGCGEIGDNRNPCEMCAEDLENQRVDGKACRYCGLEKQYCRCKQYHYLFSGVAAPFYNRNTAQNGIYMFKFSNAPFCAEYFGKQMANVFKARFPKTDIDVIAIVPGTRKDLRKAYYDKVKLLAKVCSKELKVPLDAKLIKKIRQTEKQHELKHDKRQQNVKGAFKVTKLLDGKTVLLIDDIKTTGYTLNECSKQLRMAGAEKVFCLTALITLNKTCNDDENNV